ncbi:hypothetical protein HanXRQr2_Chr01g0042981 [Helianthus annuus]|uniref:Uncharacterized protein n=1 Tax=Helianthus annuus TaxID=4232 RepID=A0A9K3JZZ5_HELAN|nr:hypothetical protein HanXRQr2_Chr01g0042981 [Helianthus annuus]KAJ0624864.1 hypothetical protein HanIR_Chr01g0047651 [Helianthus annuus]
MFKLWRWYQNCLSVHPVKTQVISSGLIWGFGDIAAQTVTHASSVKRNPNLASVWAAWSLLLGLSSCLTAGLPSWAYSRFIQLDVSWCLGFLAHIMGRRFSFKTHELLTFSCLHFCTLPLFPILTSTFVSLGLIYTCTDHPIGDLICSLFSC